MSSQLQSQHENETFEACLIEIIALLSADEILQTPKSRLALKTRTQAIVETMMNVLDAPIPASYIWQLNISGLAKSPSLMKPAFFKGLIAAYQLAVAEGNDKDRIAAYGRGLCLIMFMHDRL